MMASSLYRLSYNLRSACQEVAKLGRAGGWPHVRTVPKQFPPWTVPEGSNPAEGGIWGVQFLMHPSLPRNDLFTATYFSDTLINPIKELMQCENDDLVMELFNLLVAPPVDFELRWHRDDISEKATAEEELERLSKPAWHTQWNLPLYEDSSLIVVPGSHKRARTEKERNAGPFEKGLPGKILVNLKLGDIVFYNNNILHRGAYDHQKERMTLHGSVGHVRGNVERARNVLQHKVKEWIPECDFSSMAESERKRAEGMRERLIDLGTRVPIVRYSLEG